MSTTRRPTHVHSQHPSTALPALRCCCLAAAGCGNLAGRPGPCLEVGLVCSHQAAAARSSQGAAQLLLLQHGLQKRAGKEVKQVLVAINARGRIGQAVCCSHIVRAKRNMTSVARRIGLQVAA